MRRRFLKNNNSHHSANINNYLTIEALEDGLTASLSLNTCEYCVDGDGNWKTLAIDTPTESINKGQTLSFRGKLIPSAYRGIGTFTISKKCNLLGNCMSMLFGGNAPLNNSLENIGSNYTFYELFRHCTTIVEVSKGFLPATTLEFACYCSMFYGCTSLTTAPELPATTLDEYCYFDMFYGCTSLTTAPELPATTLVHSCYRGMFYDCSKLNSIKMLATDISASDCLSDWVYGVASTGTFVKNPNMTSLPTGENGIPSGWTVVDDSSMIYLTDNYLTICALEDGLTASLSNNACEYCVDGDGNWKSLAVGTTTESVNSGQTLSFRGNLTPNSSYGIGTFTISKRCNLKGNCMSMLFGDSASSILNLSGKDCALLGLFNMCTNIIEVSSNFLPATTLSAFCYAQMFHGCSNLIAAPTLPALTARSYCYYYMFSGCTSLTTAPELPATTLESVCYQNMFLGCTSLVTAPQLPATTLATHCYGYMFQGCTSLVNAPKLPATTLLNNCYTGMFRGCTSLVEAPELPATVLANFCYSGMFADCTPLSIPPKLPATTLASNCYYGMFYNCPNLIKTPELPATILTENCYRQMFYNCSKLSEINLLATYIYANNCLYNWVYGVASTGTFVKNPNMTSLPTGDSGIPSGWTVVNDGEWSGGGKIVNHGVMTISKTLKSFDAEIVFEFPCASTIGINVITSLMTGTYGVAEGTAYVQFDGVGEFQSFTFTPTEDDTYIYEIEVKIE